MFAVRDHKPNFAAVIVTFNRLLSIQTIINKTFNAGFDIVVVVDNASSDGTSEWLSSLSHPNLVTLKLDSNTGSSGGFAAGFDYVVNNTEADWLVCYDDDAYPHETALQEFSKLSLPSHVFAVAAAVYLPNGKICEMNRPSRNPFGSVSTFFNTLIHDRSGFHVADEEYEGDGTCPIDFSSFVGFFVRVDAVRVRLGLPRKELFIYADDMIYTHGIAKAGGELVFAPSVRFVHDCQTFHKQADVYKPLWKVYYTYRNRIELFRLVSWKWLFFPVAILKLISWLLKARFYDSKGLYIKLTLLGWWDGVKSDFDKSHEEIIRLAEDKIF